MPKEDSTAIEYIKLQWEDIRHSRSQDWSYIGVIGGVLYAIVNIQPTELRIGLCALELICAALGASMAWQHYQIFMDKMSVIEKMEHRLGIQYPARHSLLPVQLLIFLLFAAVACTFAGMGLFFGSTLPGAAALRPFAPLLGGASFAAVCAWLLVVRIRARRPARFAHTTAYAAELDRLEKCLAVLDQRPLKLVADERWTRPGSREIAWEQPEWAFSIEEGTLIKPLLLNQRDVFQFSLANPRSKQDWHYHQHTFEIYVSSAPIELEYRGPTPAATRPPTRVSKGAILVPPGVVHKVNLSGTTFVFQASVTGQSIRQDKVIV